MILASSSPRRLELLRETGYDPVVRPADIDETRQPGERPYDLVERLACQKARAVRKDPSCPADLVLAADTVVWLPSGEVLGKPRDAADARRMLHELSGITHHVSTGACAIAPDGEQASLVDTALVSFWELTDQEIDAYVASGEPMDKAGAYGIQGRGRLLVRRIEGDFFSVMGLPIARVVRELVPCVTHAEAADVVARSLGSGEGR